MPEEVNRRLRGHRFYPTAAELEKLPRPYAKGTMDKTSTVHVHYFCVSGDWWITGFPTDLEEDAIAFGYTRLAVFPEGAEFGFINLTELEELKVVKFGFPIYVERDLYWTPKSLEKALSERRLAP
jgi:hypothetical protein